MNLNKWEHVIEAMVAELRQEQQPSLGHRVIKVWRARLEHDPSALQPYQIDEIVREARRRFDLPHE